LSRSTCSLRGWGRVICCRLLFLFCGEHAGRQLGGSWTARTQQGSIPYQ
jgi:hypothetical protein